MDRDTDTAMMKEETKTGPVQFACVFFLSRSLDIEPGNSAAVGSSSVADSYVY